MSAVTSTPIVGKGPLLGIAALLAATLLVAGGWRLAELPTRTPDAPTVALRELRFEDAADGSVRVVDHRSGATIESVHGEQGFLRGSLRGLVRERRKHGIGAAVPFQLIGRADGRVTLSDPATGARIDLESFGPANAAVYTRWLAGSTGAAEGAPR